MAVSDILISPATIWYAPTGESLPDETTIDFGESWGGNWTSLGYTLTPVSVSYTQEVFDLEVEQITNPVRRQITKEDVMFETTLAELTGDNLALAFNGTKTSTAAAAGQRAYDLIEAGGRVDLDEYAFGLEGLYKDSSNNEFPVRIFLYRATAVLNGQMTFGKSAGVGIPIQIRAMADTTKSTGKQILAIHKVTAKATDE